MHGSNYILHMSDGLRELMVAARDQPLSFPISMYVGQALISGRVAPRAAWAPRTEEGARASVERRKGALVFSKSKKQALDDGLTALQADLRRVDSSAPASPDELTLIDVTVLPAVGASGTKSGGFTLPVARIPLLAVSMWWIAEGEEIQGGGGTGFGFGVAIPFS